MKTVVFAALLGCFPLFAAAGRSDSQQRLTVKGSVINQSNFGATSNMDVANSGSAGQKSVHIKGSVVNQSSGRHTRSKVSVGSN